MAISVTNIGTVAVKAATAQTIAIPAGGVPSSAIIYVGMSAVVSSGSGAPTASDTQANPYDNSLLTAPFSNSNGSLTFRLSIGPSPNNTLTALTSSDHITINPATNQSAVAASAFYVTGLVTTTVQEFDTSGGATGSSAAPSATATSSTSQSGELVIGFVAANGPSGDTFTQDSTNQGGFSTPPVRAGTTGGGATSNVTIAGGVVAGWGSSGTAKYAPAVTSRAWIASVVTIKAAPANPPTSTVGTRPWRYDFDEASTWQFCAPYNLAIVSKSNPVPLGAFVVPRPNEVPDWFLPFDMGGINPLIVLYTSSVVSRPPIYMPRSSDDPYWDASPNSVPLVDFPTQQQQPIIPTFQAYSVDDSFWIGSPSATPLVDYPTQQKPIVPAFQAYAVDDAYWSGAPIGAPLVDRTAQQNPAVPLLHSYSVDDTYWAGAPISVPISTKQRPIVPNFRAYVVDDSFWSGSPVATPLVDRPARPPIVPSFRSYLVDDTYWVGSPVAAPLSELTPIQKPTVPNFRSYSVDDAYWSGNPVSVPLVDLPTQQKPIVPAFQAYAVDDAYWTGASVRTPLVDRLAQQNPFVAPPRKFGIGDESYWPGALPLFSSALVPLLLTNQKFFGAGGQVPTKRWRYDFDEAPSWLIPSRTTLVPLLNSVSITPFVPKLWRFGTVDDATWNIPSRTTLAPLFSIKPSVTPSWVFGVVDDPVGIAKGQPTPTALQLVKPFVPLRSWMFGVVDEVIGIAKGSPAAPLYLPTVKLVGSVLRSPVYDDPGVWQRNPVTGIFFRTPAPTAPSVPKFWLYNFDAPDSVLSSSPGPGLTLKSLPQPTPPAPPRVFGGPPGDLQPSPWQVFFCRNPNIFYPAFTFDPWFVSSGTAFIASRAGASRILTTTPKVVPQVRNMPYGNDFSIIDPQVEQVTLTFNFVPWLNPGVTITSVLSVSASNSEGSPVQDPNPQGIVTGVAQIGPSPVNGAPNTAVLQQVANCQQDVTYLMQCLVMTSDNQKLNLAAHLPCGQLN